MPDESFIVQILLRAKDEASANIAALRAEIAALKREAESQRGGATAPLSKDLGDTSRAAKDAERDLGHTRQAHEGLRASTRSADVRQGQKDLDAVGASARGVNRDVTSATSAVNDHRSAHSRLGVELGQTNTELERNSKGTKDAAERAQEAAKSYEMFDAAVKQGKVTNDDARRGYQQFAVELNGVSRAFHAGSEEALNFSRMASEAKARVGDFGPSEAEIRRVSAAYKDFDQQAKSGVLTTAEVRRGYKDFASELGSVGRAFRAGSQDAQKFLAMSDQAGKNAKKAAYISPGEWNWDTLIAKTAARFDDWGVKVVSLSANLRGLALAAVVGLAQQLDTAVVGLAGGLLSVASAAVQAGAALGGALVSGISQAIPVLAVIGSAIARVKNVMQAVQLTGQMRQSTSASPYQNQIQQLQNANSMASAEHSLANAYEGVSTAQAHVRTAQEQLTIARINAIRNITDLTLAEKDAKLQAEGASISLTEAQRSLQEAIQQGNTAGIAGSQLAVQEAELQKRKAQEAVPRAEEERKRAVTKGVDRNPQVISAQEALRSSRVDLANQRFEIKQAQEQLRVAQLQSKESGAGTTQQRQLHSLTSQFTGPEKALYDSLVRIQTMIKSPNSPLAKMSDYIVAPFAKGISRIANLLGSRSAMKPLDDLAKTMGHGLEEVDSALTGSKAVHFFDEMSEDASRNIPLVAHSFTQLLGFFQSVAKTAAPVLHEMLRAWDDFTTRLNARDSSSQGLTRLSAFFSRAAKYGRDILSLAGAFGKLMMALGRDSAPSGDSLIVSLTNSMNKATDWVNTHGPQVKAFFEGTANVVRSIGTLLLGIGGTMIKVFNPSSMAAFQGFITTVILPALTKVLNVLGWITTALLNIAKAIPGGTLVLQVLAGVVLTIMGIGKLYEPFHKTVVMAQALAAAIKAFTAAEGLSRFKAGWEAFEGVMKKVKGTTEEAAAAQATIDKEETIGAAAGSADATAQTAVATSEGAGATAGAADAGAQAAVDAAEGAGGAGMLGRLGGLSGVAGTAGKAGLVGGATVAGLYGIFGTKGAEDKTTKYGLPAGSESWGAKFDRYGAKEVSDLTHLKVGDFFSGIFGSKNDESKSEESLRKFGNEISKVKGKLSDLPSNQMRKIHEEAIRLGEDPSLKKFSGALAEIANATNPSLAATKKWSEKMKQYMESLGPAAKGVAETFQNINQSTGSILAQIREVVHENSKKIAEDLGTNSKEGKDALIANFGQAVDAINKSMSEGTVSTGKGMAEIGRLVATALKEYGINPSQINKYVAATTKLTNSQMEAQNTRTAGFASGGWIPATPGGRVITAGEAGHKEVVLTTDPSKAFAQGGLLNEYLRAAPKVAQYAAGGFVADPGKNFTYGKEPQIAADLRKLGEYMHTTIYGISGYRTPTESVRVGGFPNDPHTRGEAADIGVGSQLRESASKLNSALLAKFGLYRPFYPASASEINHVQLLNGSVPSGARVAASSGSGSSVAGAQGVAYEIETPKVKGLKGKLQQVAQSALNKVTAAASKYVEHTIGTLPSPANLPGGSPPITGGSGTGGSPSANERLGRSMMGKIFKPSEWPYLQKLWTQESGWSDTAENNPSMGWLANGNASGIPQADGHGNVYPKGNARAQIAWGLKYIKEVYGTIAAAWAHEVAHSSYAMGGKMAAAPWGGKAVPIIAHEDERVLNPNQFGEVARLAGTSSSGLDHHLGFHNATPKQHFQDGGPVIASQRSQPSTGGPSHTSQTVAQLGQANINEIINVDYALKVFQAVKKGFAAINKRSALVEKAFVPFVESITNEQTGVIARMQAGFTALTTRLNTSSAKTNFKQVKGSTRLFSSVSPLEQTDRSLKDLEIERKNLHDQEKLLAEAAKQIQARIKALSKKKQTSSVRNELQQLVAGYNRVVEAQLALGEQIQSNIEQAAQDTQQRIQNQVSEISNAYGIESSKLQTRQSNAQALGKFDELAGIDELVAQNAQNHINALYGVLRESEATGNSEMVATIKQEMSSLEATVVQATVQKMADVEQAIQQQAGLRSAVSGYQQTLAQVAIARGHFGESEALAGRSLNTQTSSDTQQIEQYRVLLKQAREERNAGQVAQITETIQQLESQIISNTQALQDNSATITQAFTAQVSRQGQFSSGVYGGLVSILQTMGAITGSTNVAGEAKLYEQSNRSLEATNSQLVHGEGGLSQFLGGLGIQGPDLGGLSGEALVNAISSMNISGMESQMDPAQQQAFEGIISALLQNSETIAGNTKELAVLNGQLNQPQTFSSHPWEQFRSAVFTGMGGLMPSVAASLGVPTAQNPAYTGAGLVESGQQPYIENQHITLTSPVEVADPSHMGKQIAFAMKTPS